MAGRAGRPGMANLGQAFLLAGKEQPPDAYLKDLLHSKPGEERPAPVLRDCSEEGACVRLGFGSRGLWCASMDAGQLHIGCISTSLLS